MQWSSTRIAPLLAACLILAGCSSSLVYSPSIMLPPHPLAKDQGQLAGELGFLPETRPLAIGRFAVAGGDLTARYGLSDVLTLGVKTWADLPLLSAGGYRGGASAEAIVSLSGSNAPYRLALIPRVAALISSNRSIDGIGMTVPLAVWTPKLWILQPYAAIGGAIGYHDLTTNPPQWGYGVIGNIGASVALHDRFTVIAELAGLVQHSQSEGLTYAMIVPSLALSWSF